MYWNEIIELGEKNQITEDFETITHYEYRKVFANEISVKESESYKENKLGMTPEKAFEIRREEYNNEEVFKINNVIYYLVRMYLNQRNGTIELYMTKKIGDIDEHA